ncbi:MAG: four helix bundle protein [Prevotella sp.]|nr:four helix bundle protein [Prevotella sp.]
MRRCSFGLQSGRTSTKEQLHFYEIAYGSLMETYNQLILATDLNYIGEQELMDIQPQIDIVARMLNGLRSSLFQRINCKP